MANKKYDKAFKQQISKLHLEEGRTLASLSIDFFIYCVQFLVTHRAIGPKDFYVLGPKML